MEAKVSQHPVCYRFFEATRSRSFMKILAQGVIGAWLEHDEARFFFNFTDSRGLFRVFQNSFKWVFFAIFKKTQMKISVILIPGTMKF